MVDDIIEEYKCIFSITTPVFLSCSYVASLYIWKTSYNRDHPSTIRKRFFSVFCMMIIAPIVTQFFFTSDTLAKADSLTHFGLRLDGIVVATIVPLLLTALLFLGPLTMQMFSGIWSLYIHPVYWISNWQDLMWLRNHIVAPLSEEWVFRACTMPLLLQCMDPYTAIFVGPLMFGIAHFHHLLEQLKIGYDIKTAVLISVFQFTYTSLFGIYSSYLFIRTGHFVAPLVAHMFCNHMGFPNFSEISDHKALHRIVIIINFCLGLGLWCYLLNTLTNPEWYSNTLIQA